MAVCLVYFLSMKDPAEHTLFNSKTADEAGTQTPRYLWQKLLLHDLYDLFYHLSIIQKNLLFKCIFDHLNFVLWEQ
jgi:hypothetical protein